MELHIGQNSCPSRVDVRRRGIRDGDRYKGLAVLVSGEPRQDISTRSDDTIDDFINGASLVGVAGRRSVNVNEDIRKTSTAPAVPHRV
jgi:hypothetical protein